MEKPPPLFQERVDGLPVEICSHIGSGDRGLLGGAAVSVLDLREQKGAYSRTQQEGGLRIRGRIPRPLAPRNLDLCLIILDSLKVAEDLTSLDREIIEAVRETRSVRGAVRAMSRPVQRCYVQKRLKLFRERMLAKIGPALREFLRMANAPS